MAQKKKASAARTATTASVTLPSSQEENAPLWLISTPSYDGLAVTESSQAGTHPRKSDDVTPKAHGGDPKGSEIVTPGGGSTLNVDSTAIRGECEKALVALRRGNSTKALRLIKEACNRNETSGIAHRVQGHIFMRLASVLEDPNAKLRHFTSALESARKASSLSPQSVEYAHFYAQLLYEAAKDSKGYEDVVRECERALLIENPVDPARESLHNEQQQEGLLTAEARIDHVHQELKSLVQKANISSISTWMKTLGNGSPGEDKLRLVQLRKFENQDVPMEHRVSQPKRPHEVKKVVKTPEERRKEIEVRVAAARLLQQRDTGANNGGTTTTDSPPEDSHEKGSLQKKVERRKSTGGTNARRLSKVLSVDERTDRVREFWHSLTQEKRETLLLVSIRELKEHLTSWKEVGGGLVNSHAASDALSEALEFAQERKIWRFWACCQCGERFATGHLFHQHTSEHIGSLPQHIQKYLLELAQGGEAGEEDVIIQDKLFLNEDFTYLSLDERVVKECESVGEEAAHRPLMKGKEGEPATHTDLQLLWIFGTVEYEFQPSGWKQFREEQGQRGREVYLALEKEFQRLHALCTKKYELVNCGEALNQVERLCVVERNRREHQIHGGTGKTFEMVLKDRQQELLIRGLNARNGGLSGTQESELDAITNVLRDAQTGVVRMLPYDGNLADEDDVEALRMLQEPMHHADSRVEAVISRHREQLSSEVSPLDAKIMKATDDLQKLEIKLRQLAVLDYRAVALPLVKSLLQSRLEGEAEKDAMQKSDAAQEAFLAELAKDQKSVGSKEVENLKQARGKSKEKRKSKDQKKLKDVKRVPSNSELQGESASLELEEVDDPDNWDWTVGDGLNQQQRKSEISLHQTELYKEERKLLEALELQRRVEEETKQKHLDEQERKKQQITQQQIIQPLEDGKDGKGITTGTLSTASGTVHVSLPSIVLPSPLQLLSVQNGYQSPTEEADDQTVLPSDHTKDTLCSHPRGESTRGVSEEQLVTDDDCNKALENVGPMEVGTSPAGKDVVLLGEDGDHLNSVQKKTRGGGSRNRRRRGPRIYAEEGIIANQHAESCKASDPRTLTTQQSALKNNGKLSTVDQSKPLLRQNALRRFGGGPPANGVPLLLLPAPPSFEGSGGHEGKKTLRQLQAEQDDEERFQADLEQAMRQSLDMLTSPPIASISVASSPPTTVSSNGISRDHRAQQPLETGALGSLTRTVVTQPLKEHGEVGKGLRNEIGQYNCFLNVVIQSLWHLRRFREELLADSSMQHAHVGSPCVVCALRNIFLGLNTPVHNTSSSRDAVAPTALRVALSALYSDSDFFQEAQMNDASEVLAVIFECVHKAFVPNSSSDGDSESSTTGGSWDCQGQHPCMAHALFGLDVAEQMNCQSCGLESRHLKYTAFFHNINASALRAAKGLYPGSSMDELLKLVDMNHQLACDTETGGCGRQNHIHHLLHAAPCVFTTVLGWQNGRESFEDISATVDAMDSALDVGVIYRGLEEGLQHRLVSVVCYYGQHYHCFAYNQEHCRWVMFDDSTVKVIGEWRDVTSTCRRGHLQPQVLFYEAVPVLPEAVTTVAVC